MAPLFPWPLLFPPDGTRGAIEVETLQPPEWMAKHRAAVGAMVPIPLDLAEMGLPADLRAKVGAIEPCPPIQSGPGSVVLTTVTSLSDHVLEVGLADESGQRETLRPTRFHKFYSKDREKWISARDLSIGEHVPGKQGILTVVGIHPVPGVHRVYNMTVETQHVYHVSALGVLSHNLEDCWPFANDMANQRPGIIVGIGPGRGDGIIPTPPGYGLVDHHFVFIDENNQLFDPRFPKGIPVGDWFDQWEQMHNMPPDAFFEDLRFVVVQPGDPKPF